MLLSASANKFKELLPWPGWLFRPQLLTNGERGFKDTSKAPETPSRFVIKEGVIVGRRAGVIVVKGTVMNGFLAPKWLCKVPRIQQIFPRERGKIMEGVSRQVL